MVSGLAVYVRGLTMTATLPGRWRLSFNMPQGFKVVTATFLDDENYEPPQGRVCLAEADGSQRDVGRWLLSEDPDDRRAMPLVV